MDTLLILAPDKLPLNKSSLLVPHIEILELDTVHLLLTSIIGCLEALPQSDIKCSFGRSKDANRLLTRRRGEVINHRLIYGGATRKSEVTLFPDG